jgi:hypothetical protein
VLLCFVKKNATMLDRFILTLLICFLLLIHGKAQTIIFSDDFTSPASSATFSTVSPVATGSAWKISRTGADWGARINAGVLELTNDASSTTTNVAGNIFGYVQSTTDYTGTTFQSNLGNNTGPVEWTFNMQQIRTAPSGFSSTSYGVAFVLGSTTNTPVSSGNGYAVLLGGSAKTVRLARFSGGLGTLSNITDMVATTATFGADYLSIKVIYTPSSNTWELFVRNDGTTTFANPESGSLTSAGTLVNSTYTATSLPFMGCLWNGSTAASQNAKFDQVKLKVTASCVAPTTSTTNASVTTRNENSASFGWTRGNGDYTLGVMSNTTAVTPSNGVAYTENTVFGTGDLLGAGSYAVYASIGTNVTVTGLSPQTQYTLNLYEAKTTCYQLNSPATTSFYTFSTEPVGQPSSFNTTTSSFNSIGLSFSAASSISNADGYLILQKIGSNPTGLPTDGQSYVLGSVIGDATLAAIINSTGATSTTISGLTDNTNYYFSIIPFNNDGINGATNNYKTAGSVLTTNATTPVAPSSSSDVVANAAFIYSSDIDYTLYQASTFTNTSGSIAVYKVTLRDGGSSSDADTYGTTINSLVFKGNGFSNLRGAVLADGNAILSSSGVIDAVNGTITFTGLNITAVDNGTKDISLRVSFLTNVTDNVSLIFNLSSTDIIVSSSGSQITTFATLTSNSTSNKNKIEVTATGIRFAQQPVGAAINVAMNPSPTVEAVDINNNRDLDFTGIATLTSTGTMDSVAKSRSYVNGLVTLNNIIHTLGGTGLALTVGTSGFSNIVSATFLVSSYPINSYRTPTSGTTTWPTSSSTWEQFNGSTWTTVSAPGSNTGQTIYIRNTFTTNAAFGSSVNFVVESGGICNLVSIGTANSLFVKAGGKAVGGATVGVSKIQIDSLGVVEITSAGFGMATSSDTLTINGGGQLTLNSASMVNTSNIWKGIERFQNNSTVEILDWNYSAGSPSNRIIASTPQITANSDGYYFGNFKFSGTITAYLPLFASSGTGIQKFCSGDLIVNANASSTNNISVFGGSIEAQIGGNLKVNSGQFSVFASTAAGFPKLHVLGNVEIASTGTLNINQGSAAACIPNLLVYGNISGSGNLLSSDGGAFISFSGNKSHQISYSGTIGSNVRWEVKSNNPVKLVGQSLNFGNSNDSLEILSGGVFDFNGYNLLGSGTFVVRTGGQANITSADGINATGSTGNVQVSTRTLESGATIAYTGNASPQYIGTALNAGNKRIIINKDATTQQVLFNASLTQNDSVSIIEGTLVETPSTTLSGTGVLKMTGGKFISSYLDSVNKIPQLSGAYQLTGGFIELNGNGNQVLRGGRTYHNVIFSGTNQSGIDSKKISSAIVVNQNVGIQGNAIVDFGNSSVSGGGGLTMVSGVLRIAKLSGTTSPELDATATGATYQLSGGTIEFYGSNATGTYQRIRSKDGQNRLIQYYNLILNANGANIGGNILAAGALSVQNSFQLNQPTVLDLGAGDIISGNGSFTMMNGSTLKFAHNNGLAFDGQIQVNGLKNYGNAGNFVFYSGGSNPNLGLEFPDTANNITLNISSSTCRFPKNVAITSYLSFNNILQLDTNQVHFLPGSTYNNSGTGYIDGKVKKTGNTAFIFPIGYALSGPKNIGITAPDHISDAFSVAYKRAGTIVPASNIQFPLTSVNACEYWQINEDADFGSNNTIQITMSWDTTTSRCGLGPEFIQNINNLTVAHFNGLVWENKGATSIIGNAQVGSITSDTISNFSPFRLGSTGGNSLPVGLTQFQVRKLGEQALIQWTTASEMNVDRYEIERSEFGQDFQWVGVTRATNRPNSYSFIDQQVPSKRLYYRLKMIDFDGSFQYSSVQSIDFITEALNVGWYSNQGASMVHISTTEPVSLQMELFDNQGRLFWSNTEKINRDLEINLPEIPAGFYHFVVRGKGMTKVLKIVQK